LRGPCLDPLKIGKLYIFCPDI